MNRLQSELLRLYLLPSTADVLIGPSNTTRCLVLEVSSPPGWDVLSKVWQGVQSELELPAAAIAVDGEAGIQLWFSLDEPITAADAGKFLEGLRLRFLPEVPAGRVRFMPWVDTAAALAVRHARLVPACQVGTGNWSAFVAPDLAPVFAETPWLDIPPSEEGQATLLRGLQSMKPAMFEAALKWLAPSAAPPIIDSATAATVPLIATAAGDEARRFLLQIMNDGSIELALRIDAAKALLQSSNAFPAKQRD